MKLVILTAWSASQAVHGAPCSGQRPLPEATAGVWCVYRVSPGRFEPLPSRRYPEGQSKMGVSSEFLQSLTTLPVRKPAKVPLGFLNPLSTLVVSALWF